MIYAVIDTRTRRCIYVGHDAREAARREGRYTVAAMDRTFHAACCKAGRRAKRQRKEKPC